LRKIYGKKAFRTQGAKSSATLRKSIAVIVPEDTLTRKR
jgi:hypothetical protein